MEHQMHGAMPGTATPQTSHHSSASKLAKRPGHAKEFDPLAAVAVSVDHAGGNS